MLEIITLLLILNILIVVHEFGHFIFAKRAGVVVKEFAIGLGPAIWKKEIDGTVWRINWIPLGGYNAFKGENETEPGKGNYSKISKKNKLAILFAGSGMNIILAILCFYLIMPFFNWKVPSMLEFEPVGARLISESKTPEVYITAASENSTFRKVELKFPLQVLEIDGQKILTGTDVRTKIEEGYKNGKTSINIKVKDVAQNKEVDVDAKYIEGGVVGISLSETEQFFIDYGENIGTKAFSGISHSINIILLVGKFIGVLSNYVAKTNDYSPVLYSVSSPVGIYPVVQDIYARSELAIRDLVYMTGLIGINLGLFNLLPFPGLDGWHILIVVLEKVRRRKFNEETLNKISLIGLIILLGFSLLIVLKDIVLSFFGGLF